MESVHVNTGGTGNNNKGFGELNYHKCYKQVSGGGGGGGGGGVVGEGQGLSEEEDESKNNEVVVDTTTVANGRKRNIQTQEEEKEEECLQRQQPQGSGVCWERFLPLRSLKVLLVENDDSTRQVVSALLRNCSYEVTPAANGLQAWRILQDLNSHIDLILTEVVMPCMSGIALLCKIMNHKTCKNIPVIMMSSHDSMGIVFKCLSKGAVDFLVKPIRKNELKNLWQHVWRRCHSSSGSGSESAIQTKKSAKSKSAEGSDNNTGSNDEDDNASIGLGIRDGSDNGSGTQSSWTKRAVEVDSPQLMSPCNQLAYPPDSTCAQVIHPKPEESNNDWGPITSKEECQEEDIELHDNIPMGKDLEIGVPRNADLQLEYASENVCTNLAITNQDKLLEQDLDKSNEQLNKGILEINRKKPLGELRNQAVDNKVVVTDRIYPQVETSFFEAQNGISNSEVKDKASTDANEVPSLELSLKRLRGIKDVGSATHDDRNVLRRSDLSAFSRYNTASTANQTPTGNVGSCSPLDNSSDAMKTDSMYNQQSNGSSNNNDMGSTTKNVVSKPAAFNEISASTSTAKCHPSAFQPVQNSRPCPPLHAMPQKDEDVVVNTVITQTRGANQQVQVQHHHHHYHHHHHHVHNKKQEQPPPETDELSLSMATTAVQCGSSNVFGGPNEGNTGNYSLNGSGSGSNHGSNGQNGSSKPVNIGGMKNENDNVLGGKSEVGGGNYSLNGSGSGSNHGSNGQNGSSKPVNIGGMNNENDNVLGGKSEVGGGSGSGSGMDQNRFAQREAALNKFRLKRKERCFEKKVRYQSRKKLAEQRPRVRGQFVRQAVYEPTSRETKS